MIYACNDTVWARKFIEIFLETRETKKVVTTAVTKVKLVLLARKPSWLRKGYTVSSETWPLI